MAARYQKARFVIAASVAASVITGTAYFASNTPASSAANTPSEPATTTLEAPKVPTRAPVARRSRAS